MSFSSTPRNSYGKPQAKYSNTCFEILDAYLSYTARKLPASCRTPLQIPDEAFVLSQSIGQGWLRVWSVLTRVDEKDIVSVVKIKS